VFCHRGQVRFLESYTFRVRTRFFLSAVSRVIIDSPSLITSNTRFVARWVSRLKITKFKKTYTITSRTVHSRVLVRQNSSSRACTRVCYAHLSHAMQSIRTTRGAKRVYAAPCNAGYEIFSERGGWKVSASDQVSMDSPEKYSAELCLFSIR